MQYVIDLNAVTQTFVSSDGSPVTALQGVDLHLRRHEFVSLIGPSGCGKSTILRLIAGLIKPSQGEVRIFDLPVTEPRDEIGMVFQKPTLLPWISVLDNITFPMRHKYGHVEMKEEARAKQLLDMVGLKDFGHKQPHELSGGMQQRVSIARALAFEPKLLMMDEPFGALDEITRDRLNEQLQQLWQRERRTVVFVTHSIAEAVYLSTRIVVMSPRPGRIVKVIKSTLPNDRHLGLRDTPEFMALAHEVRESLADGHH